jgi:hypothetical protein
MLYMVLGIDMRFEQTLVAYGSNPVN